MNTCLFISGSVPICSDWKMAGSISLLCCIQKKFSFQMNITVYLLERVEKPIDHAVDNVNEQMATQWTWICSHRVNLAVMSLSAAFIYGEETHLLETSINLMTPDVGWKNTIFVNYFRKRDFPLICVPLNVLYNLPWMF